MVEGGVDSGRGREAVYSDAATGVVARGVVVSFCRVGEDEKARERTKMRLNRRDQRSMVEEDRG